MYVILTVQGFLSVETRSAHLVRREIDMTCQDKLGTGVGANYKWPK